MVTERQLQANRQNAQQSTGPQSVEGIATACLNALTHGLWSQKAVLPWESQAEYDAHCRSVLADLAPAEGMERTYAQRIAFNTWRIQRAVVYEARVWQTVDETRDVITMLNRVSLIEGRISRAIDNDMEALSVLQEARGATTIATELYESEAPQSPSPRTSLPPAAAHGSPMPERRNLETRPFASEAARQQGVSAQSRIAPTPLASFADYIGLTDPSAENGFVLSRSMPDLRQAARRAKRALAAG